VHDIVFRVFRKRQDHLRQVLIAKIRHPWTMILIARVSRLSMPADVSRHPSRRDRTSDKQVDLLFITTPNYLVGDIRIEALRRPPFNQIVTPANFSSASSSLRKKDGAGAKEYSPLMQENGYYRSNDDRGRGYPPGNSNR